MKPGKSSSTGCSHKFLPPIDLFKLELETHGSKLHFELNADILLIFKPNAPMINKNLAKKDQKKKKLKFVRF